MRTQTLKKRSPTRAWGRVEEVGPRAETQSLNLQREEEKTKGIEKKKRVNFEEKGWGVHIKDLILLIMYTYIHEYIFEYMLFIFIFA